MDRITKQLIKDYLKSQEREETNSSDDFEYFCNYSIVSSEYNRTFETEAITVGNGADTGIDGIAIIVNGHIIEDENEIDDLLTNNGYLEVTYLFVQAKSSSNFNTPEMHQFYFGVQDFFSENPNLPRNKDIKKTASLSEYIISNASEFKANPKCKMFYITTGTYNEIDANLEAVRLNSIKQLESLNLFDEIESKLLGANEIGKLYRKTKNPTTAEFIFANKVTLNDVEGIDQSYYGVLPYKEFKSIIIDANGNIKSVFDDNVRDFQGGMNPVNKNIAETIDSNNPYLFSVLNNGVTIVANSIKTSGNNFIISDYQIVNGCQTSNVLYEHRHKEGIDNIEVPVRLVVTSDDDVKSRITVSTNNQTAIKKEQLSAMSDFQKNLEHYYSTIEGDGKLYYERRAKQYNADREVVKRRIITVSAQIKTFSSMFLKNPHLVTSYYGSIVKKIGEQGSSIFESDHQYATYYLAGLAYYRLDSLFNTGAIDKKYKKVRYFLLMLVPQLASEENIPPLNSHKKVERYCAPIIKKLNNVESYTEIFINAVSALEASGLDIDDKLSIKSKTMTDQILSTLI